MKTKPNYLHFFIQVMAWILLPLVILKGFSEYLSPAWIERSYAFVFLSLSLIFYGQQIKRLNLPQADRRTEFYAYIGINLIIGFLLILMAHDWTGFIGASVLIAASQIAIALMERPPTDQDKQHWSMPRRNKKGYYEFPLKPLAW